MIIKHTSRFYTKTATWLSLFTRSWRLIKQVSYLSGVLLFLILSSLGCSSVPKKPYLYTVNVEGPQTLQLAADELQISFGRPHKFLDAADWFWPGSLFSKLLLWNKKVDSHQLTEADVILILIYLWENDLHNVKVRLNDYDVADEWRRLVQNKEVGAGWRWTVGLFSCVLYTIMPGRFFGGDNYNPYTNTINIYSSHPAIVLHEAAHAKDFAKRRLKGTYAAAGSLPFVSLYHEAQATRDVVGYLRTKRFQQQELASYKVLYPAYGTYIGGEISNILQYSGIDDLLYYAVMYAPVLPCHVVGRYKAWRQQRKYAEDTLPLPAESDD